MHQARGRGGAGSAFNWMRLLAWPHRARSELGTWCGGARGIFRVSPAPKTVSLLIYPLALCLDPGSARFFWTLCAPSEYSKAMNSGTISGGNWSRGAFLEVEAMRPFYSLVLPNILHPTYFIRVALVMPRANPISYPMSKHSSPNG